MKICKKCSKNKPLSCFRKDDRYKSGYGSWCCECHRERNSEWAKENRDRVTEKAANWREENPEKQREINRKWKSANKEKTSAQYKKWREANLDKDCARVASRKAKKINATPLWANQQIIKGIYKNRPAGHDVDHIVPLVSDLVCGLHCEANLQYLPKSENQSKRNFYWPDMPSIENAQRQGRMFEPEPVKQVQEPLFNKEAT